MITFRRKVLVWVSAVVMAMTLVVLPGCKKAAGTKPADTKSGTAKTDTKKTDTTKTGTTKKLKDPTAGME